MFEAFIQPIAWGTPGGLGFMMACLGVFFWGLAKLIAAANK